MTHVAMTDREAMRQRAQGMIRTLEAAMMAAIGAGNRKEAAAISVEIAKWEAVLECGR